MKGKNVGVSVPNRWFPPAHLRRQPAPGYFAGTIMQSAVKKRLSGLVAELILEGREVSDAYDVNRRRDGAEGSAFEYSRKSSKWDSRCRTLLNTLGERARIWNRALLETHVIPERVGVLEAIKDAIDNDWLVTVEDLVYAEAFSDLLEQAEHLFAEGYFLAAGVLGRAVLEEHLRKWCEHAHCIPAKTKPTMADCKAALYKHNHINKIEQAQVEAMAAVGNEAAHNTPGLKKEDVGRLLRDVRDFLARHPFA